MTEKRFTVGEEILKKEDKCCICESKKNLEPHHILHTTKYDELHNSIENLIVMCHNCHHNYHQKYHYDLSFKTLLQFQKDYWKKYCPKLKKENGKLHKQNSDLKKRIRMLVKK